MTEDEAIDATRDLFMIVAERFDDIAADPNVVFEVMDDIHALLKERFVETSDNA